MMLTMQSFVQRRYHTLVMASVGFGFVLLIVELLNYRHYQGLQIIGLATVVLGAIAAFLGIRATGGLHNALIVGFFVLSLAGLVGAFLHNADRLFGERRPEAAQATAQRAQSTGEAGPPGGQIPPPLLAPLSVSGLCVIGAFTLLDRKAHE